MISFLAWKAGIMKTYQGNCHCGAITFSFAHEEIREGVRCNCSLCKRKGAVMSPFTIAPDKIQIGAKEGDLSCYQFGSKVASHYYCKHCGVYTFHKTLRNPDEYRVNLGCIDDIDIFELPISVMDGKSLPD